MDFTIILWRTIYRQYSRLELFKNTKSSIVSLKAWNNMESLSFSKPMALYSHIFIAKRNLIGF